MVSCSSDDEANDENTGTLTIHYSESDYKGVYYAFQARYNDFNSDGAVFITTLDEDKDAYIGYTSFQFSTDEALSDLQEGGKIVINENNVRFSASNEDDTFHSVDEVTGDVILKKKTANSVTLQFQNFSFERFSDKQTITINGSISYKLDE